jgi:hypothetical protein
VRVAPVVALLLLTSVAQAGQPAPPSDDTVTIDDVRAEDESRRARWAGVGRLRAGYPLTVSGSIGAIRTRLPESWECLSTCPFQGWVIQVEPGLHGVQLGAGYATLMAEKRHNKRFLADVYVGYGVKGIVVRTWGDSPLGPDDQTLAGAEFSFTVTRVNFSLGTLRRISGRSDRDWAVTYGMGWGF